MPKLYDCTISIGDNGLCQITCQEGAEPTYRQGRETVLSAREFSAINCIMEVIRCLSLSRNLDTHFNPTVPHDAEDELLMKMRWNRAGKLVVLENEVKSRFMHAKTTEEALARKRTFTCTRKTFHELAMLGMRRETKKFDQGEKHGNQEKE